MSTLDPRSYYVSLCEDIPDRLQAQIVAYMAEHGYIGVDNRITREGLCRAIFGKSNRRLDRKIRKAKEGSAILSTSGKAGYFLPATQDEVDIAKRENLSRIRALKNANSALEHIQVPYRPPAVNRQKTLWEELT